MRETIIAFQIMYFCLKRRYIDKKTPSDICLEVMDAIMESKNITI